MPPNSSPQLPQKPWFFLGGEFNQPIVAEPPLTFWRELANYDSALLQGFIEPLALAVQQHGSAPTWLQKVIVQHLHWYFTVDARERAPTVVVSGALVATFHERVREIMRHVASGTVEALDAKQVSAEVRQALLSYKEPHNCSAMALDAYDHDQGLARVTYYVHGEPPAESFLIDGNEVQPAYAKYRACNYFSRRLLRQRIVWLQVAGAATLEMKLAGAPIPIALGAQHPRAGEILFAARVAYPPGKGGQKPLPPGWAGWKVRLMKKLARMPMIRQKFVRAWVFTDREEDADDNAEHLYRWVHKHHPEINAWFLLKPNSSDWHRLKADGFRLVQPSLARKLLILNSEHIVSSHADLVLGGFDPALYGSAMHWRFTYLRHGVSMHDQSHWLGPLEFDRFVTTGPNEHASISGDNTAYPYTERETRLTGLPRHDKLLQMAKNIPVEQVKILLIMPTWRGSLKDDSLDARNSSVPALAIAESNYAKRWGSMMRNERLHQLVTKYGLQLVFLPHPNAVPYVPSFDVPSHVEIAIKSDVQMQNLFVRTVGFITDYTSVAFDMAFLRRPVFYYQFDRKEFYGGDHNWRPGYFDFDRDGFGPVALTEEQIIGNLDRFLTNGCQSEPRYLARMESAVPYRDDNACTRVYESMLEIRSGGRNIELIKKPVAN